LTFAGATTALCRRVAGRTVHHLRINDSFDRRGTCGEISSMVDVLSIAKECALGSRALRLATALKLSFALSVSFGFAVDLALHVGSCLTLALARSLTLRFTIGLGRHDFAVSAALCGTTAFAGGFTLALIL
jgi:hypothetical protein